MGTDVHDFVFIGEININTVGTCGRHISGSCFRAWTTNIAVGLSSVVGWFGIIKRRKRGTQYRLMLAPFRRAVVSQWTITGRIGTQVRKYDNPDFGYIGETTSTKYRGERGKCGLVLAARRVRLKKRRRKEETNAAPTETHHENHINTATATTSRQSATKRVPCVSQCSPASIDHAVVEIGLVRLSKFVKTTNVTHAHTHRQTS